MELNKIHNIDCLEFMKTMPDKCVDLVLTDPPYGINYLSNHYKYGNPHVGIRNDSNLFFPEYELWQTLKNTGSIFAFYSYKKPIKSEKIKNQIIWVKNNWSAGDLTGDFGNQYETIAFMPKCDFKLLSKRFSNVWHFDRQTPDLHPTQKPLYLITRIIDCASNPGDLVFDPFMGSGTTAVACKELGRNYIGCEISKEYCKIAERRLAQEVLDL